jgi:hypothetical protein
MNRYIPATLLLLTALATNASAQEVASQPIVVAATTSTTAKPATITAAKTASGTLLKKSEVKVKPFIDAKTLAKLPRQTRVTILERNGGWFRVQAAKKSGWVRMLNVKVTAGAQNLGSGTDLTQAATLATGRAGTGNVVATSGLRGLSEEELRSAKPDYTQFDKLNGYGADTTAAGNYAKSNGLNSRSVQYLPAPAK